mmetsp:Transcript_1213/g.2989  ORF Transcript_1213/g.2989 Transcript_1213/m.2989 type:complete len:102 (-) Transcript_1213:32-337(-)
MKSGGSFLAPRTILKVRAWGDKIEYPNGKLAFSNIHPVRDMGMPQGYLTTNHARRPQSSRPRAQAQPQVQSSLARMRSETEALEAEVAEMERVARGLRRHF